MKDSHEIKEKKKVMHNPGLINTLDSIISSTRHEEELIKIHTNIRSLNNIIFNLLIISSISLVMFLSILITSIVTKTFETKEKILGLVRESAQEIKYGSENIFALKYDEAEDSFNRSATAANYAKEKLNNLKPLTASLSIIPTINSYKKTAEGIIESEKTLSRIGNIVIALSKDIENESKVKTNNYDEKVDQYYKEIELEALNLEKNLKIIDEEILPSEYGSYVSLIKDNLSQFKDYLLLSKNIIQEVPDVFGFYGKSNYLILLQNNNELRGSGGFIGNVGILSFEKGRMTDFFIDDVYNLDKPYSQAVADGREPYLNPPYPMDPASTGNWALRDSSVSPDFPTTAKNAISFYKKEIIYTNNPKYPSDIKGVISITPTLFEDALSILGPIALPEYNLTLNGNNLLETLQLEIESGKDKQDNKNPKIILELLKNRIMERTSKLNKEESWGIFGKIAENLDRKHVLLYSTNQEMEDLVRNLGWSGEVKELTEDEDYLMITNNNFGGGKSSLRIDEDILQELEIKEDGTIMKKVTVKRTHTSDYALLYYDPWSKKEMWLIGDNNNYLKMYVPEGSKIAKTEGIEGKLDIFSENGKTVFGTNMSLVPKQTKTISITYELPFKQRVGKRFGLFMQKQPGTIDSSTEISINNKSKINLDFIIGNMLGENGLYTASLNIDRYLYFSSK